MAKKLCETIAMRRGRTWRAKWIWHAEAPARNAWCLFRYEFDGTRADGAVSLFITADTRYRVWINGMLLGDGPPQSQPYLQYYDQHDISGYLRTGRNSIAVVVQHQGVQDHTRGGLLAEIVDAAGKVLAATGSPWRTALGRAWRSDTHFSRYNRIGPFQEHVDLRQLPAGWYDRGFDDTGWQSPVVLSGRGGDQAGLVMPWCRLIPRDIEFLRVAPVLPERLHRLEECLDLENRFRGADLSISLSQAGRPVAWSRVEDADKLLAVDGETVLGCSDRHEDRVTDGRYDPCLTLDFGRVLTGYAEIEAIAPAGARLEIGYAERLIDDRFNNAIECSFADQVIVADGEAVFRPLVWRSFRYLRIRLKHCQSGIRIKAIRAIEVNYPYRQRGLFTGDARLESIFEICRTTVSLCSIESIMDTPFREQAQWLGDVAAVTIPCIYACFGDQRLPRKFLEQAAMNTRPSGLLANISNVSDSGWQHDIPDYSLWWVIALWRHYRYTGDCSCIHQCYPEMQRIMRVHLERVNDRGLLDQMFGWVFIDWAPVDSNGMSAAYNAIFAGACEAAASIAAVKGDTWAVASYSDAAQGVRAGFQKVFISPQTGLVVDAVSDDGQSDHYSEHANSAAIAFDCVGADVADRLVEKVFVQPETAFTEAQPFFMVVVLKALCKADRRDVALRLIAERWGQRMVDRGRTSCTEEWYENGSWRSGDWSGFERTHSHAWSACPAAFLTAGMAGIQILEPGCGTIRVDPYRAPFPYRVVYPTPLGDVTVAWDGRKAIVDVPDDMSIAR